MRIDHVIYLSRNPEATARRFEQELGLESVEGGRHSGMGTHNRIIPLGGGYLELMGIADQDEASGSQLGRAVRERLDAKGEGLFAWCIEADEIASIAARLGTNVTPIEREGLSAQLTALNDALRNPSLPFFIRRDAGVADPGAGADHGGITWVEVAGDPDQIATWLDGSTIDVRVVRGDPGVTAMGIGDRELRI